jgi:WXXGXW repeat (2 copies)
MRIRIWMAALTPFALIGCADETPVTTQTTVTREVTTTGPVVTTEPVASDVYVEQAPPAVRVETQTIAPGPGYTWTPGYWRWSGAGYVWVSGSWVRPPRVAAVWVRGHWVHQPRGWVWVPGHWR